MALDYEETASQAWLETSDEIAASVHRSPRLIGVGCAMSAKEAGKLKAPPFIVWQRQQGDTFGDPNVSKWARTMPDERAQDSPNDVRQFEGVATVNMGLTLRLFDRDRTHLEKVLLQNVIRALREVLGAACAPSKMTGNFIPADDEATGTEQYELRIVVACQCGSTQPTAAPLATTQVSRGDPDYPGPV